MTKFWLALLVLLLLHTCVCLGADRIFSTRLTAPRGAAPIETTTPEQAARGERVFTTTTRYIERPVALVFYAISGYAALLVAAVWGLFSLVRSH